MKLERTAAGLQARFQIIGAGRFGQAAFLALWLIAWAASEAFALWMFAKGLWSLVTGGPLGADGAPLSLRAALPAGLFLLFWLTFWTFGGMMAGQQFLWLLFGRDRIVAGPNGLEVVHSYGFFRSRREAGRGERTCT